MSDQIIKQRMERFQLLLDKSGFGFKQYQYDGVEWCIRQELTLKKGGMIADEMGLGKTITMIGTMFCNFLKKTLIVVPPVLIQQWRKEILRVSGHHCLVYYGANKKKITAEQLDKALIILTSYGTLQLKGSILLKMCWSRAIFDEAHHLRNDKTKRFCTCNQIWAPIRWLVTGTPIQNKAADLKSLCRMIKISNFDELSKHILRRKKSEVGIDLPQLVQKPRLIKWQSVPEMLLSEEIHALLPNQSGVSTEKRKKLAETWGEGGLLVAMVRAKQSCIMPELMRKSIETFIHNGNLPEKYLEGLNGSSKLDAVVQELVKHKENGKGKIVFCQYRREIDILLDRLTKEGFKKVVFYDGRNSGKKGLALLTEPADVLVIQIQTGCEGLNLQEHFSEIYFVSPHWNPRVEDQAIARCYRIGQQNAVNVFKFIMNGFKKKKTLELVEEGEEQNETITIEKYISKVQDFKRQIGKEIIS
jgi:SNF2 family DNA or RNA helicase